MRIVAGEFRGRLLRTLPGRSVRPTSDKLRETLFNVLRNDIQGSVFIDCYAGSGAVGLEAVSRGATHAYLIEQDVTASKIIQQNIASLGVASRATLLRLDARAGLKMLGKQGVRANIGFLDPPYAALPQAVRDIQRLAQSELLLPLGLIILEHARKDATLEQIGEWSRQRLLTSGSSALSFYRHSPHN